MVFPKIVLGMSFYRVCIMVFTDETYGSENGLLSYVTVRNAIEKYPYLEQGENKSRLPNHICSSLSKLNQERINILLKAEAQK